MSDSDHHEELAGRLSDGQPVDWEEATDSGIVEPGVARQFEVLDRIAASTLRADDDTFRVRLKGRYRLVDKLGAGGMGEVYAALREHLGDLVAIKMLPPSFSADRESRERLHKEARILAQIKHPNVAQIHDLDEHEGRDFIVMELVHGETLRHRLQKQGPYGERETIELGLQILAGLGEAHANRVIHRDLKPENLIVTPEGNLKILDFGIAKQASHELTAATAMHTVAGTAPYMAPEQLLGKKVDERTDLYTVGVILAELATGKRPYEVDAEHPVLDAILNGEPVPVRSRRPELSQELEQCIQRLLSKDPAERYASTRELSDALREIHGLQFSEIRPHAERRARSRILPLGAAVLVLILLAVLGRQFWPNAASTDDIDPKMIAVFPFNVRGDETIQYLGEGMVDLLHASLDGAGDFKSIEPTTVMRTIRDHAEAIDPEIGRDFSKRMRAGLYVLGSIVRIGQELRITATLYDESGNDQETALASTSSDDQLPAAIDAVATEILRGRVGTAQLPPGIKTNMTALRAFLSGQRAYRIGHYRDATDEFERAVAADSSFAFAYARLAAAASTVHYDASSVEAGRKALELRNLLPAHLVELVEVNLRFDHELSPEMLARLQELVRERPDDSWAWFMLMDYQMHCGPLLGIPRSAAAAAFERAFQLAQAKNDFMLMFHKRCIVGDEGQDLGSYAEALDACLATSPDGDLTDWTRLLKANLDGDEVLYRSTMDALAREPEVAVLVGIANSMTGAMMPFETSIPAAHELAGMLGSAENANSLRVQGVLLEASLDAAQGRFHSATGKLRDARSIELDSAIEFEAYVELAAFLPPLAGDDASALTQELIDWTPQPAAADWDFNLNELVVPHEGIHADLRSYLLGLVAALSGDLTAADLYAETLEREAVIDPTRALAAGIRGQIAFQQGDYAGAVSLLQPVPVKFDWIFAHFSSFLARTRERFLLAESYRAQGDLENALAWYEVASYQSTHDIIYRAPCYLRQAEIHEQLGNRKDALKNYRKAAELWSDCDAQLRPMLVETQAAIARLGGA